MRRFWFAFIECVQHTVMAVIRNMRIRIGIDMRIRTNKFPFPNSQKLLWNSIGISYNLAPWVKQYIWRARLRLTVWNRLTKTKHAKNVQSRFFSLFGIFVEKFSHKYGEGTEKMRLKIQSVEFSLCQPKLNRLFLHMHWKKLKRLI